jgi:hypothetical protein
VSRTFLPHLSLPFGAVLVAYGFMALQWRRGISDGRFDPRRASENHLWKLHLKA